MKYLIIGAGATGCSIGGFLISTNKDVTFISRGENLEQMKKNGLKLKTGIKGEMHLHKVNIMSQNEYIERADVIFICVKSYSLDDIIPFINKASHEESIIIPIMNGYNIGEKIVDAISFGQVLEGCIYISAFIEEPGVVVQLGNIFSIVFGTKNGDFANADKVAAIKNDLIDSGIKVIISDDIGRDTFKKFTFVSACASCGAYYDIQAKEMQKEGKHRETFIALCEELKQIGDRLKFRIDTDITETNLKILDALTPEATASLQKDIKKGGKTEIEGLIF
ncbi:MAG: 2-dehydropantoate 2-reductase, partial [Peptostreptococcaceae bacterium]|nr:2-dehydropantoate 2-reductase [Peptostreptococcaceae bacterium]